MLNASHIFCNVEIAGIVVSAIALKKAKSGEYETDYAGLAKAGLIISIIAVVLEVLAMIFAMTIIAGAAATANEMINTLPSGMLIG